jgi:hypothetical protein
MDRDKRRSTRSLRSRPEAAARVEALGASLRPTSVVRLVHLRLDLFAKLEYNNVVDSFKVDRVSVTPTALVT